MSIVLNMLVIAASVLGSSMAFPQAKRLVRTGRVEGISATWIGVSLALNTWWLIYGFGAGVWAVVPVSIASLAMYAAIAVAYSRVIGRVGLQGIAVGAVALGALPIPFALVGGWATVGLAVGLGYGLQLLPAVVGMHRTTDLSGVSPGTWLIAALESAIWLAYGSGIGDIALVLAGVTGVVMTGLIVLRLGVTGHRPLAVIGIGRIPATAQ